MMNNAADLFDRLLCYEHVARQAGINYKQNPQDTDMLSKYHTTKKGMEYLRDAVSKLEKALELNPKQHKALWCLGNAYTAHALFIPDITMAKVFFDKATKHFQQAVDEAPSNYQYRESLENAAKAPDLHVELYKETASETVQAAASSASIGKAPNLNVEVHNQMASQTAQATASSVSGSESNKEKQDNKFDILGFIVLTVGAIAWFNFSRRRTM